MQHTTVPPLQPEPGMPRSGPAPASPPPPPPAAPPVAPPVPPPPPPLAAPGEPEFAERHDDPAQAEELERQQDA